MMVNPLKKCAIATTITVVAMTLSCGSPQKETTPDNIVFQGKHLTINSDAVTLAGDTIPIDITTDTTSINLYSAVGILDSLVNGKNLAKHEYEPSPGDLSTWELSTRIALYDSWESPWQSMEALRGRIKGGRVVSVSHIEEYWPMISDCLPWIIAAEEVYYSTGDRRWLAEATEVARRTLTRECLANFMPSQGLFRGVPVYLMSPESHFAPWMTDSDILMSMTLFGNAVASHAIASFGRMSDILGLPRDRRLDSIGAVVAESIDRKFWLPDRGYYSGYLYGSTVVPIQSQIADNMGQAMALYPVGGITPVKKAVVKRTPRFETGMSLSFPLIDESDLPARQIFFNTMQSIWTIASMQLHDQEASVQSLAAMCLKTAQTGNGSHDALRAVVMRGVLGMFAVDTGIVFNPFVPDAIRGMTEIRNLKIRDAVYDIRLAGNGSVIRRIELDGKPRNDCGVTYKMKGHHLLSIELGTEPDTKHHSPVMADTVMTPPPPQVFWCNRSGRMLNYNPEFRYEEYVDGVLENRNIGPEMQLDSTDEFTTVNLMAIDKRGWAGFAGKTFSYFPARTRYVVSADSIEPGVKGRLKTIRNKRGRVIRHVREPHLVKLPGWNHELHFNYTTRYPGDYAVSFTYTSPSGKHVPKLMTLRRMKVNGHESGIIVMPQIRQNRMQESSWLRVKLHEGTNRFSLSTDPFLTSDQRGFNGEVAIKEMILIKIPEK